MYSNYDDSLEAVGHLDATLTNLYYDKQKRAGKYFFEENIKEYKSPEKRDKYTAYLSEKELEILRTKKEARDRGREAHTQARACLSNVPYLNEIDKKTLHTLKTLFGVDLLPKEETYEIKFEARPGGVKLRVETRKAKIARLNAKQSQNSETVRGKITELSEKARKNMVMFCNDLEGLGIESEFMTVLTYPKNHEQYAEDGKEIKRQLNTFHMALNRYFKAINKTYSAMWYLEFQTRGAPHFHIEFFNTGFLDEDIRQLRKWVASTWVRIVKPSNNEEKQKMLKVHKHHKATEKKRKTHWGYAKKYAAKMQQKEVPEQFNDVGRFWGYWNYKKPKGVVGGMRLSFTKFHKFVSSVVRTFLEQNFGAFTDIEGNIKGFPKRFAWLCLFGGNPDKGIYAQPGFTCTLFGKEQVENILKQWGT